MTHQINDLICYCEDGKYRLKSNSIYFEDKWYESECLEEETAVYEDKRYWKEECLFSNYLNQYIPEDIFHEYHFYCEGCDTYFHDDERTRHTYSNNNYCQDCFYEYHTYCSSCEEAISNDYSYFSDINQNDYCQDCYYELHGHCDDCDADYWSDDGCDCCSTIHSYSYKPDPTYFKNRNEKPKFYIGLELETESKGNSIPDCAEEITDISELYYIKKDGSLDDGFEVVTHPFSYNWYLENQTIFNSLLEILKNNGFRSYNTTTCGIHIHISKNYLSGLDLAKLHLFFCQNENFITQISQREQNHLDNWGKIKKDKKVFYDQSKKKGGTERYTAINLQNSNTVEFRIFRGTLHQNSYHKNIEFIIALCEFIKVTSLHNLTANKFYNTIKTQKNYKHLTKFMEEKQCA